MACTFQRAIVQVCNGELTLTHGTDQLPGLLFKLRDRYLPQLRLRTIDSDLYVIDLSLYLTGEMRHHQALAATTAGLTVVCVGHSNSERQMLHRLAKQLKQSLPKLQTFVAASDVDPFEIV